MDAFWRGGGRPLIKRQTSVVEDPNHAIASSSSIEILASPDVINIGSEHSEESFNGIGDGAVLGAKVADSLGGVAANNPNILGIGSTREPNSSTSSVSDDSSINPSIPVVRVRPEEAEKHFHSLDTILCPLISSFSASDPQMSKCAIRRKFYTQTYMHYPHSISLGKSYGDLARVLRTREVIQLTRDYVMRIGQIQSFIYTLQRLAIDEHSLLLQKRRCGPRASAEDSKVDCLVAICDDMRSHITHWSSLTNKLLLSDWLKCFRWRILQNLQGVRKQLHFLMQVALWWLAHLINTGIHVFAITPYHQIPENILWNVTRGVEEFGIILELARSRGLLKQLHSMGWCAQSVFSPQTTDCNLPILSINNQSNLAKLLNEISKSRSSLVAELIYEIFSSNDTIVELLNLDKQSDYTWSILQSQTEGDNDEDLKDGITIHLMQKHISSLNLYIKMEESFATQILTSLSTNTNMMRKTNVRTGPTGGCVSPRSSIGQDSLASFSRFKTRRSSEASNYFQESSFSYDNYKPKLKAVVDNESTEATAPNTTLVFKASVTNQDEPEAQVDNTGPVRKPRKSVKWNDSTTSSAINHLKARYLNLLWMHLKETLGRMFREPSWTTIESGRYSLGDVRVLSTTGIMFVSKSLHHLSSDDTFGPMLRNVIQYISKWTHGIAVKIYTDQEFRKLLVSTSSDKAISNGDEISATTKIIIGAVKPSISLVESIGREQTDPGDLLTGVSDNSKLAVNLWNSQIASCMSANVLPDHLIECATLIGCYTAWFTTQMSQSTLSWNVQSYVNLAHIDLIMVKELVSRHLNNIESLLSQQQHSHPLMTSSNTHEPHRFPAPTSSASAAASSLTTPSLVALHVTTAQLKGCLQALHTLSGESEKFWKEQCEAVCRKHWQNSFPLNKVWKTRSSGVISSTKPQEYAQRAIVGIVEPVARGASSLRVNSQVKIVGAVLSTLFQTWMNYILENRVRFTVVGAYQLSVDFDCIQKWVSSNYCHLDPEAVNQLNHLHIFQEANAVIGILQDESYPPHPLTSSSGVKMKNAHSLLEMTSPNKGYNSPTNTSKGRLTSGTTSAPILRELDTNSSPTLDKRRKILLSAEGNPSESSSSQNRPFGNFFASARNDVESLSVLDTMKGNNSVHSDSSLLSSTRVTSESNPSSDFVRVHRQSEWQALRASSSLCPPPFGIVQFLCADTEN